MRLAALLSLDDTESLPSLELDLFRMASTFSLNSGFIWETGKKIENENKTKKNHVHITKWGCLEKIKRKELRDENYSISNLTNWISSLPVSPEVFVQSCEPVLQQTSLRVSQFWGNGHGRCQNISDTKRWIRKHNINTWWVSVTASVYLGRGWPELVPAR